MKLAAIVCARLANAIPIAACIAAVFIAAATPIAAAPPVAVGPPASTATAQTGDQQELARAKQQAADLHARGDYRAATRQVERALEISTRLGGASDLQTAALQGNLAVLYSAAGKYAQAHSLFDQSLATHEARLGPDHPDVAMILSNLADLDATLGKYDEAESRYQRSLRILESRLGKDHVDLATVLDNLGLLYKEIGLYAQAEPLLQRSLAIRAARRGADHPETAGSLNNLASLFLTIGRYDRAEPLYRRSLAILERRLGPDHPDVVHVVENLGLLQQQLGQYADARQCFERSLKTTIRRLGPDHPATALCLGNLANLELDLGRYDQAATFYRQALANREKQLGPDHPDVAKTLHSLAVLCRARGQAAEAEAFCRRSLAIREAHLGGHHPDVARSLTVLGNIGFTQGKMAEAEENYRRALSIYESGLGGDHPDATLARHNLARLLAAKGQTADACAEFDRARRASRRHATRVLPLLGERQQLLFLERTDRGHLFGAIEFARDHADDPAVAEFAAEWLANGKAVAQESLAERALWARNRANPALAARIDALEKVRGQLAALALREPRPGSEESQRREIAAFSAAEEQLASQIRRAAPAAAGPDPWVDLAAIRRALPADAVLIDLLRLPAAGAPPESTAHYLAAIVPPADQGPVQLVDLGDADAMDRLVRQTREQIEASPAVMRQEGEPEAEARLRKPLAELSRRLLQPLAARLQNVRELIFSPDGDLWLAPFAALVLDDGRYAVERYAVRYLVSGREPARQAASASAGKPCVFANPDFDLAAADRWAATRAVLRARTSAASPSLARRRSESKLPKAVRLPNTATEAASIERSLHDYAQTPPILYLDKYALEGVVKAVSGPRLLVVATHGFFMPDQQLASHGADDAPGELPAAGNLPALGQPPAEGKFAAQGAAAQPLENPLLRCGLLLAGANAPTPEAGLGDAGLDDGVWTGVEIVGTRLEGTELVVLSACETGLGQVDRCEGVSGLRQAFQLAGAATVLATLWSVPDRDTALLMSDFFGHLAAGQDKSQSLRSAQLQRIQARRQRSGAAHPLYWAAFTVTGR